MKALIAYGSMTGQTERVALAISSGMKEVGFSNVTVKNVKDSSDEDFGQADVWIIGTPTHFGSATGAVKSALRSAIRKGVQGKRAAVFDTRLAGWKRGGTDKLSSIFSEAGIPLVCEPASFTVTKVLDEGEEAKAATFGRRIAGALRP